MYHSDSRKPWHAPGSPAKPREAQGSLGRPLGGSWKAAWIFPGICFRCFSRIFFPSRTGSPEDEWSSRPRFPAKQMAPDPNAATRAPETSPGHDFKILR